MGERDLAHSWKMVGTAWFMFPGTNMFLLFFYPLWEGIWGYPIIIFSIVNLVCGFYVAFRVEYFFAYYLITNLAFGIPSFLGLSAAMISGAVLIISGGNKAAALGGAVVILLLYALLISISLRRVRRSEGRLSDKVVKRAMKRGQYRAYMPMPVPHAASSESLERASPMLIGLGIGLVNVVGFWLFGDANLLREMLIPFFAVAIQVVFGIGVFKRTGGHLDVFLRLREIEKSSGHRFILGNIEELHRARRAHWLGRFITPKELKLHPIHGRGR